MAGLALLAAGTAGARCAQDQAGAHADRPAAGHGTHVATASTSARPTEPAQHFVQRFYDWFVPRAARVDSDPWWKIIRSQRIFVLDPALAAALNADVDAQEAADGEIVGIDFEPFTGSQDPCDRYQARSATPHGGGYDVSVFGLCPDQASDTADIVVRVAPRDGGWRFVNFRYPRMHTDLLTQLRVAAKDREDYDREHPQASKPRR